MIVCEDCDIERYILENEPVSQSEIRGRFGREGFKDFSSLLERDMVFEGEDDEYWHVGTNPNQCPKCETQGVAVEEYAGQRVTGVRICTDDNCCVLEYSCEVETGTNRSENTEEEDRA